MLRVTAKDSHDGVRLIIEGRLTGAWVGEVERFWKSLLAQARVVDTVDVQQVLSIDAAGRDLLNRLYRNGAHLLSAGCLMNSVVDEIEKAGHSNKKGCGSP